jgi:glycosyltransferase involved in cell wall biosynthesis
MSLWKKRFLMITIVMAYFDRQKQLDKTLLSFAESKYKDFNVVIVDDDSPVDITLPKLPFDVAIIKMKNKTWIDQALVYNTGFNYALKGNPDIVMFQNPECYHVGDVLDYASRITNSQYISFGCFALAKNKYDLQKEMNENDYAFTWEGQSGWYNHPVHRPVGYHFCSVLTAKNLIKINGFDERFSDGRAYSDDYLVHQVKSLGLQVDIPIDPFVVHQYHYNCQLYGNHQALWYRNQRLYENLSKRKCYRAEHTFTPNLDGTEPEGKTFHIVREQVIIPKILEKKRAFKKYRDGMAFRRS